MQNTAVIVEGGAMRGIFSAGVLDAFYQQQFNPFELCIGVSAGAINLAAWLAGMHKRSWKIYTDYNCRGQFISWAKYLRGGHLIDLDWLWEIAEREIPLDTSCIINQPATFLITVTNADTGQAEHIEAAADEISECLRASSALPTAYRATVPFRGREYVDGTVSDPLPVQAAIERGAKRIMLIRSRPRSFAMKEGGFQLLSRVQLRGRPAILQQSLNRGQRYNAALKLARRPPEGVFVQEICPPEDFAVSRLTTDTEKLEAGYQQGIAAGISAMQDWKAQWP